MNYYKIKKLDRENVRMLVKVCTSEELIELQLTFKPDIVSKISKMEYQKYKRREIDGIVWNSESLAMVHPRGLEPPTHSLGNCSSIQLSYGCTDLKLRFSIVLAFWLFSILSHFIAFFASKHTIFDSNLMQK